MTEERRLFLLSLRKPKSRNPNLEGGVLPDCAWQTPNTSVQDLSIIFFLVKSKGVVALWACVVRDDRVATQNWPQDLEGLELVQSSSLVASATPRHAGRGFVDVPCLTSA